MANWVRSSIPLFSAGAILTSFFEIYMGMLFIYLTKKSVIARSKLKVFLPIGWEKGFEGSGVQVFVPNNYIRDFSILSTAPIFLRSSDRLSLLS